MNVQDKSLVCYVSWLILSAGLLGPIVHEFGHYLGLMWLSHNGPVVIQYNGLSPLHIYPTISLPFLNIFAISSFWILIPGLAGGGLTEATYWYLGNRFLINGLRKQERTLFSFFVLWNVGSLLVYSVVEVIRNAVALPLLWSPIGETLATYGIGFFAVLCFRDFREGIHQVICESSWKRKETACSIDNTPKEAKP